MAVLEGACRPRALMITGFVALRARHFTLLSRGLLGRLQDELYAPDTCFIAGVVLAKQYIADHNNRAIS